MVAISSHALSAVLHSVALATASHGFVICVPLSISEHLCSFPVGPNRGAASVWSACRICCLPRGLCKPHTSLSWRLVLMSWWYPGTVTATNPWTEAGFESMLEPKESALMCTKSSSFQAVEVGLVNVACPWLCRGKPSVVALEDCVRTLRFSFCASLGDV